MTKVTIHSGLATVFGCKGYNANQQHAYALWEVARHYTSEFNKCIPLDFMMNLLNTKTGRHPNTLKRWIRAGVEMGLLESALWFNGHPYLYVVGLETICDRYLEGKPPGRAYKVELDHLLSPSLQKLRAVLEHCFCGNKKKIISRTTQSQLSGWSEQTHRNRTRQLKEQGLVYVVALHEKVKMPYSGNIKIISQKPNMYINTGLYEPRTDNPIQSWDEDNSRRGYTPTISYLSLTKNKRMYFHDKESAEAAYKHRVKMSNDGYSYPRDTYFTGELILDGRKYNTLERVRPYTSNEIPEDILVKDIQAYDEQTTKMEAAGLFDHHPVTTDVQTVDNNTLDKHMRLSINMLKSVNTPIKKPRKTYTRHEQFRPLSELTEVQQIEIMLNPELAVLL